MSNKIPTTPHKAYRLQSLWFFSIIALLLLSTQVHGAQQKSYYQLNLKNFINRESNTFSFELKEGMRICDVQEFISSGGINKEKWNDTYKLSIKNRFNVGLWKSEKACHVAPFRIVEANEEFVVEDLTNEEKLLAITLENDDKSYMPIASKVYTYFTLQQAVGLILYATNDPEEFKQDFQHDYTVSITDTDSNQYTTQTWITKYKKQVFFQDTLEKWGITAGMTISIKKGKEQENIAPDEEDDSKEIEIEIDNNQDDDSVLNGIEVTPEGEPKASTQKKIALRVVAAMCIVGLIYLLVKQCQQIGQRISKEQAHQPQRPVAHVS